MSRQVVVPILSGRDLTPKQLLLGAIRPGADDRTISERGGNMRSFSSIIWGLIFIAVGVALLLDRFHYIYFDLGEFLGAWWPLILVIIGLGMIFDRSCERGK